MIFYRNSFRPLQAFILVSFISRMISLEDVTDLDKGINEPEKKEAPAKSTGYKTSEVIEKAPTEDHPCTLIRTSERISFPALRNELFVNFLGYREPNLVHVMRCKGV